MVAWGVDTGTVCRVSKDEATKVMPFKSVYGARSSTTNGDQLAVREGDLSR
jgi:hypothetical protein